MSEEKQALIGWRAIENYLKMNRKTILARGFPVRKWGGVYAIPSELDAHFATHPVVIHHAGNAHIYAGNAQPSL